MNAGGHSQSHAVAILHVKLHVNLLQGHTASITYRVQRSYGYGWDIQPDQLDVPAGWPPVASTIRK